MNRRTDIDFSRHELIVSKTDKVLIHIFKRPDTNYCSLIFINTCGVMTVTGDFGNWVFNREFHPSVDIKNNGVCDSYWDEKLCTASIQDSHIFDCEETIKEIERLKSNFEENYGRVMDEEELNWVNSLEFSTADEHEYIYTAYNEKPRTIDYDDIPFGKKRHYWLNVVYDGFDEICKYLVNENNKI